MWSTRYLDVMLSMCVICVVIDELISRNQCAYPSFFSGCGSAMVDLVFVLDASTSVTAPNFELMKKFVKDFILEADVDGGKVKVGMVVYSTADHVEFYMNDYASRAEVERAIDEIVYRQGNTNTADGIATMRDELFAGGNGERPGVPNVAIVVTDGQSNINRPRTIPEAEQARSQNIKIYAVGIGLKDTSEIDGIASKPVDEYRYQVDDFAELDALRHKVFAALCGKGGLFLK